MTPREFPCPRHALRALRARLRRFGAIEAGAVTVDWTVLTAAAVGLGIGAVGLTAAGVGNLGETLRGSLSGASVSLNLDPAGGGGDAAAGAPTGPTLAMDLQAADQAQLQRIRGIGPARAQTLLAARDNGLNLNTASAGDLQQLSGIGAVLAERTIRFRDEGCVADVCN